MKHISIEGEGEVFCYFLFNSKYFQNAMNTAMPPLLKQTLTLIHMKACWAMGNITEIQRVVPFIL